MDDKSKKYHMSNGNSDNNDNNNNNNNNDSKNKRWIQNQGEGNKS